MKKGIRLLVFFLSIFVSISNTGAFYYSSNKINNTFDTKEYTFKINSNGGNYKDSDITIYKGKTTLPTPTKNGYTFLGYSSSSNGNVDFSTSINNIEEINNDEIYAKWNANTYSISYNLNGGSISGNKTTYTIETNSFTLPTPTKTGYNFDGWSGTGINGISKNVTINKGATGNRSYTANWSAKTYSFDVNPIIDGTSYNSGLGGFTFDVYKNGKLVANNVTDFCENIAYGTKVRVVANGATGFSTNFDKTYTITGTNNVTPTWTRNYYNSYFYYPNGAYYSSQRTLYGYNVSAPSVNASSFGYNGSIYEFNGWTANNGTWVQQAYDISFTANIGETYCYVSFGDATSANSQRQIEILNNNGHYNCRSYGVYSACEGNYSYVASLYNSAWSLFPRSGLGYSVYSAMWCNAGYSAEQKR